MVGLVCAIIVVVGGSTELMKWKVVARSTDMEVRTDQIVSVQCSADDSLRAR